MRICLIIFMLATAFIPDGDKYWMQRLTLLDALMAGILIGSLNVR